MSLTIKTNRQWREFVIRWDVPKAVLADLFDYQDEEETTGGFFCYHGTWYHLDGFTAFREPWGDASAKSDESHPFYGWDASAHDGFSSGVLIKLSDDGEQYQVGRFSS